MLPILVPNYELVKFMGLDQWSKFYADGAYGLGYALSYVRVNWLLNDFGII